MADNRNTSDRFLEELARVLAEFDKKVDKLDEVLGELDKDLTSNRYNSEHLIKSVIKSVDRADKYKSLTEKTIKDMAQVQKDIGKDWQYRFIHAIKAYFNTIGVANPNLTSEKTVKLKGVGSSAYNDPSYKILQRISHAQNTGSVTANFTKQFIPFIREMHQINKQQLSLLGSIHYNKALEVLYRGNKSVGTKQLPARPITTGIPLGQPYSPKKLPVPYMSSSVIDLNRTQGNKFEYAPSVSGTNQLFDKTAYNKKMYEQWMKYYKSRPYTGDIFADWTWKQDPVAGLLTTNGQSLSNKAKEQKQPTWLETFSKKFLKKLFNGLKELPIFQVAKKATADLLRIGMLMYASNKNNNAFMRKLAMLGVALQVPETVSEIGGDMASTTGSLMLYDWLKRSKFSKNKAVLKTLGKVPLIGKFAPHLMRGLGKATPWGIASVIGGALGDWGVSSIKNNSMNHPIWSGLGITGIRGVQGALVGAGIGALAGSFIPVLGTAIGGAVGAGLGGLIGIVKGIGEDTKAIRGRELSLWDKITGNTGPQSLSIPVGSGLNTNIPLNGSNVNANGEVNMTPMVARTTPNLAKTMVELGLGHNAAMLYAANSPYYSRLTSFNKIKVRNGQLTNDIPYLQTDFKNSLYTALNSYSTGLAKGQFIDITGATATMGDGSGPSHKGQAHKKGLGADVIVRNADGSTNVEATKRLTQYLQSTGQFTSYTHDVGSGLHGHVEQSQYVPPKKAEVDDGTTIAFSMMNTAFPQTLSTVYGLVG